jgi:20S proteasome subunit alpha 5
VNTFSPEGRIYQIEYAIEAIKVTHILLLSIRDLNKTWLKFGSTAIGVRTNEGVVLGVEKKFPSKLMEPAKSEKLVEVLFID